MRAERQASADRLSESCENLQVDRGNRNKSYNVLFSRGVLRKRLTYWRGVFL